MAYTFKHGDRPLEGYVIQRGVGRGGFGEVYYAVSDGGKEVALKYLRDNPAIELRGVSNCLNLKNPQLVSIFDVRQNQEGEYFIVMEYVSGPSLRDLLIAAPPQPPLSKGGTVGLGVQKAAYFLREIGKGLSYLHERGIVHRDLKPGNIFYEDGYVKIGDYGLSKFISTSQHSVQTASVGTVHYMAPEVGSGSYTQAVDIYALGVMLYEMLLGRVPYEGATMGEVLMKHLTAQPEVDQLPHPFAEVIRKALAKDPKDRFQTVDQMVECVFGEADVRQSVVGFNPKSLSVAVREVVTNAPPRPVVPSGPLDVPKGLGPSDPGLASRVLTSAPPLAPEAAAGEIRYAGFWIRAVAALLDLLVLSFPIGMANMVIPGLGTLIVVVAYEAWLLGKWNGQTVGKKVCGIKVINQDGTALDVKQGAIRSLASVLSFLTLGVGYIMVAFDSRKRALHDRVAGTLHIYALDPGFLHFGQAMPAGVTLPARMREEARPVMAHGAVPVGTGSSNLISFTSPRPSGGSAMAGSSSTVPADPNAARYGRWGIGCLLLGGLLLAAAPLPVVVAAIDGRVRGFHIAWVIVCGTLAIQSFIGAIVLCRKGRSGNPRLSLPLQRSFVVPRWPDLHDLIQRYLVLLGYKLTSNDRLLWSFKRGSSAGEWSCDIRRCKTRLGIAAFEVPEGYRVNCSIDVDGTWGSWVTQKEMRLLTDELEGLEDLLKNGAAGQAEAGRPIAAGRWQSNLEEVSLKG